MIFLSAVTGADGRVDAGYLALYWSMVGWSGSSVAILAMSVFSLFKCRPEDVANVVQSSGIALGAVAGAFATVVGAVGLFRMGDKDRAEAGTTTRRTSSEQSTTVVPPVEAVQTP